MKRETTLALDQVHQSTLDHARRVLALVSSSAKLAANYPQFLRIKPSKGGDAPNNLKVWVLSRIRDLCGAKSFEAAYKDATFKNLLALGYMSFADDPSQAIPKFNPYARVPAGVAKLEPDFFKVLADKVDSESKASPAFAARLKGAREEVERLLLRLQKVPVEASPVPRSGIKPLLASDQGGDGAVAGIIGFLTMTIFFLVMGNKTKAGKN